MLVDPMQREIDTNAKYTGIRCIYKKKGLFVTYQLEISADDKDLVYS